MTHKQWLKCYDSELTFFSSFGEKASRARLRRRLLAEQMSLFSLVSRQVESSVLIQIRTAQWRWTWALFTNLNTFASHRAVLPTPLVTTSTWACSWATPSSQLNLRFDFLIKVILWRVEVTVWKITEINFSDQRGNSFGNSWLLMFEKWSSFAILGCESIGVRSSNQQGVDYQRTVCTQW